jgi:hypothetical protein
MAHASACAEALIVLARPRCRIPLGEAGEDGSGWKGAARLPLPKQGVSAKLYAFPTPKTQVRALAEEGALCVRFDCQAAPARLVGYEPALATLEHAWLRVWPANDPTESLRFQCDFKGMRAVTLHREITGERSVGNVPDLWAASTPAEVEWTPYFGIHSKGWWVEMVIPWRSLGLKSRPAVIGLSYGRQYATGRAPKMDTVAWPAERPATSLPAQLEPAEALIGGESAAPERVELGPVRFGANRGRWVGGRAWPRGASLRARTETAEGKVLAESRCRIGADGGAEFTYRLDRGVDSYLDVFAAQRLTLEAVAKTGAVLYSARLPFGRHLGVCVDEAYGERGLPDAATRRDDVVERAARALPRLHRRDTNSGAPSDFCLADDRGEIVADLAGGEAWEQLAAIVEERSSTAEDRLALALALAGQKSVSNLILGPLFFNAAGQATYHSVLHDKMGSLSVMRYGGGPAAARAHVLARLLRQVRDPRTGKPFVTRVLSLARDGGPKRAARHDVFGQRAAPVGVVAVEYGGSSTLLDPSALAIFPRSDGTLATVEEVLTDGALRAEGAGQLSQVYAKVDAEELRREPANRTPSKGVFPELFADEDRPDRPFDPRERQLLRSLVLPPGGRAELAGFLDVFGNPGVRDAVLRVERDADGLRVCVTVKGPPLKTLSARDAQEERVHLAVDVEHGHARFAHFSLSAAGERLFTRDVHSTIQTANKHLSSDQCQSSAPISDAGWSAEMRPTAGGHETVFRVSWDTLRAEAPKTVGLGVWIEGRAPAYEQLFLTPPRYHLAGDSFNFADLYLGEAAVTVEEIDLGVPTYNENSGFATLRNNGRSAATVLLHAENRLTTRRRVLRCAPVTVRLAAGERKTVLFPFHVSPEEKMGGPQRIVLALREGRRETWRASWGIGYCGPLSAYERFGSDVGPVSPPRPGARDFMDRKIKWICSRIPCFERLTTRQGAPSDFFLRAEDGSAEFNLMKPGVMQEMADYVAGRFDNDLDRILGIWLFGHAPFLGRHMSFGHHLMVGVDPLSLIRGNFAGAGGNCGFHSRLFGGLACYMKVGGESLLAHGSVAVWGHVISAVGVARGRALVDGDVGHIFLTADGRNIATLDDLRRDLNILTTAGPGELGRYFHCDDAHVRIRRSMLGEKWPGSFPAGAPQG